MKKNWKADEMEISINYKATRNAFAFCVFSLFIYCAYDFITTGSYDTITFLILVLSGVVFWTTKLILTNIMTKSGDENA